MVPGPALTSRAADWIGFAAAPTFAVLALLTDGTPDMLCAAGHGTAMLGGMSEMYLLMSAVHLAPWLKLIARHGRESYP